MTYYSQWGQDRHLAEHVFKGLRDGVYVDVGAHDGTTLSNTRFFDDTLNWTGICVEPMDNVFEELVKNRPRAKCVNACAYDRECDVDFFNIAESVPTSEMLSGICETYYPKHLDRIHSEIASNGGRGQVVSKKAVTVQSLLDEHNITRVDYLSIDTEGSEQKVLDGIDWARAEIAIIDVENNYPEIFGATHQFLLDRGYKHHAKLCIDELYIRPDLLRTG